MFDSKYYSEKMYNIWTNTAHMLSNNLKSIYFSFPKRVNVREKLKD